MLLKVRNGRRIRIVLTTLIEELVKINPIQPLTITEKSKIFQGSCRYVFFPIQNPIHIIFKMLSVVYIMINTKSAVSCHEIFIISGNVINIQFANITTSIK